MISNQDIPVDTFELFSPSEAPLCRLALFLGMNRISTQRDEHRLLEESSGYFKEKEPTGKETLPVEFPFFIVIFILLYFFK